MEELRLPGHRLQLTAFSASGLPTAPQRENMQAGGPAGVLNYGMSYPDTSRSWFKGGMDGIDWQGAPPRGAVLQLLGSLELAPGPLPKAALRVVSTRDAAVPVPGGELRWLWLSAAALPPAAQEEAALRGAYDSISLAAPFALERLRARLCELKTFSRELPIAESESFVGKSAAARRLLAQIAQAARTSQPVLLTGETGTGKEVAAQLIHSRSSRARGRFVPINCAAIPNELMEGELFGYAKGAFSGAVRDYEGLVSAAAGGSVFLDEIDDTPHPLQVKLLRVLEDRKVSRLGENSPRQVDFRILAATNRDLRKLVADGAFGDDLYERLAVLSIQLPPLRERAEDLPELAQHLFARFYREEPAAAQRGRVHAISPEALRALVAYPWPGNIRELRNVLFGMLVAKRAGDELLLSDLPRRVLRREGPQAAPGLTTRAAVEARLDAGALDLRREVELLERTALAAALDRAGGSATRAARLLGTIGRGRSSDPAGTVRAMIRRLGL
jgi:transcriptional regulator with PAS, ATPase and Fis domain